MSDCFEVGAVLSAGSRDPGCCGAALGGGELGARGGEVSFRGFEFRVEARGGRGELGLAARETFDAGVDSSERN